MTADQQQSTPRPADGGAGIKTGTGGGGGRRPVVLCILDGWGCREEATDNAVALADTPVFDRWWAASPRCLLRTDGLDVGLPPGQFGNSEVGHMNLGAGRVVMQDLPRIDAAIEDGSLAARGELRNLADRTREAGGRVHLLGLLSPGGVHAHQRHLAALAGLLAQDGAEVLVHAFLDGRDTPPRSAAADVAAFLEAVAPHPSVRIATLCGRYWAMDRDRRWERVERAYRALALGEAPTGEAGPVAAVLASYARDVGDEFVEPVVVLPGYAGMRDGDGLLCANFRSDRAREIMGALVDLEFDGFARAGPPVRFAAAAGMASYSARLDGLLTVLFPPQPLRRLTGEVVAEAGLRQLRMAETEKYPHVTFFFNGGEERQYPGEERILVPSPKVATYDLQPEMSAPELTDRFVDAVGHADFALINFANPDMVGHTGVLEAAVRAVETVDGCLGRVLDAVLAAGGVALVTADHGNCELMRDPVTGEPHTAHTLNPVPCMVVGLGGDESARLRDGGRLADVAPTVLALLGVEQPVEMTGRSLLLPPLPAA